MNIYVDKIEVLKETIEAIKYFENHINEILRSILQRDDVDALLVQMNKENMYEGLRSDGSKIKKQYSPYTKKLKALKGQPIDRITWKDTGELYRTLRIVHTDKQIEFKVDVPQYQELNKKYGANGVDSLGLTIEEVISVIKPEIQKAFREFIFSGKSKSIAI